MLEPYIIYGKILENKIILLIKKTSLIFGWFSRGFFILVGQYYFFNDLSKIVRFVLKIVFREEVLSWMTKELQSAPLPRTGNDFVKQNNFYGALFGYNKMTLKTNPKMALRWNGRFV